MNLPNVFQNNKINTNKINDTYYSRNTSEEKPINIKSKIDSMFKSISFVYKINVIITTKNKEIDTTIIGKSKNYLITMNNELINIKDILDIKIKKDS